MKLLVALLVMQSASPPQFDLECSGAVATMSGGPSDRRPYALRLRVDLAAGVYCEDRCLTRRVITEVQPTRITFVNGLSESGSTVRHYVNRDDGFHSIRSESASMEIRWAGRCEARPFSGFPVFPTRF